MRPSTATLAVLVIVAAACQLTAAGTIGDVGVVAVTECDKWFSYCKPTSCTEDGKCIFSNPLCSTGCSKCECTPHNSYATSQTTCPYESTNWNCGVKGCRQDGSCVMSSWQCQQRCDCACAITAAAESEFSCTNEGNGCEVIGCTPDNKCLFNKPNCKSECKTCACIPVSE